MLDIAGAPAQMMLTRMDVPEQLGFLAVQKINLKSKMSQRDAFVS
jgi:hypothetical protein